MGKVMLFVAVVGLLGAVTFGSLASAETNAHDRCVAACNEKWTKAWLACGETSECRAYVEHEGAICIRHCQ
jgi:hypothetical protein